MPCLSQQSPLLTRILFLFNSSLASPDSETLGNVLVVVVHGYGDIARMEDIGISKSFAFSVPLILKL